MAFLGTNEQPMVVIDQSISGSDTHARVAASTSAVLLLSSSEGRTFGSIFNHGSAGLYIGIGRVPTLNFFDVKLTSGSYFELQRPTWQGPVYGIWDATNGFAMINDIAGSVNPL